MPHQSVQSPPLNYTRTHYCPILLTTLLVVVWMAQACLKDEKVVTQVIESKKAVLYLHPSAHGKDQHEALGMMGQWAVAVALDW